VAGGTNLTNNSTQPPSRTAMPHATRFRARGRNVRDNHSRLSPGGRSRPSEVAGPGIPCKFLQSPHSNSVRSVKGSGDVEEGTHADSSALFDGENAFAAGSHPPPRRNGSPRRKRSGHSPCRDPGSWCISPERCLKERLVMTDGPRRRRVVVFNASEDTVDMLTTYFLALGVEAAGEAWPA
jgi:hypothetical protein